MQPIDYSKWDHIECSSDESVHDHDGDDYLDGNYEYANKDTKECSVSKTAKRHPSVTKLEFPSKVVIGPDGVHMERMPETATSSPFQISHNETHHNERTNSAQQKELLPKEHAVLPEQLQNEYLEEEEQEQEYRRKVEEEAKPKELESILRKETQHKETEATENTETDKIKSIAPLSDGQSEKRNDAICNSVNNETDVEDDVLYCNLIKNGGREGDSHLWSQTADTVTVSFIVPFSTKSKNVNGFRITDNYSAETYQTKSMIDFALETRESENGKIVITPYHNTFRYPVKLDEDLIDGCWQLQTIPSRQLRLLVVQVFKREVGVGMTLWWDKCFSEDTLSIIDPCQIKERKCRGNNSSSSAFYETWQKAHAEFKKRMKERKSNQIELEEELKS